MSEALFPATAELTPHAAPMLLVDEIAERKKGDLLVTLTTVSERWPFFVPGRGIPSYVGFELMAQTVAIFDGLCQRDAGKPPSIGLLVGCRKYSATRSWFEGGEQLRIEVELLGDQGELKVFTCAIRQPHGDVCATGAIKVFRPDDVEGYFLGLEDRER